MLTIASLLAILSWQRKKRNNFDLDQELVLINKQFNKVLLKLSKIDGFHSSPSMTVRDIAPLKVVKIKYLSIMLAASKNMNL